MAQVSLVTASLRDAKKLHSIKYKAFLPLYEKYGDDETSPINETIGHLIEQMEEEETDYYIVRYGLRKVGGVRVYRESDSIYHISPFYILPKYQNQGVGYRTMKILMGIYGNNIKWKLNTMQEEKRNCYFYEKCGFTKVDVIGKVNDNLTLIGYEMNI